MTSIERLMWLRTALAAVAILLAFYCWHATTKGERHFMAIVAEGCRHSNPQNPADRAHCEAALLGIANRVTMSGTLEGTLNTF